MSLSLVEAAAKLSSIFEAMAINKMVPSCWMHRLTAHFNQNPSNLPVVEAEFPRFLHPCIQIAIDHYLSEASCRAELVGVGVTGYRSSLNDLLDTVSVDDNPAEGPVKYLSVEVNDDAQMSCVERGVYLFSHDDKALALALFRREHIVLEVMAGERAIAEEFLSRLRVLIDKLSIYRGHVLSLSDSENFGIKFHKLSPLDQDSIVLPAGLLERIERHAVDFAKHKDHLLEAGFPLKRGILLHGVPGTGKTLTVRYLLTKLSNRTTILVHGHGLRHIEQVCDLARTLNPSIVVIEDVDLIAEDRKRTKSNPALVDLLNQMDGLANDADVLFVLTTNRAEILEPALKSRPGRIDQAIEIPLPDEQCRQRLFELYTRKLHHRIEHLDKHVEQTKGASPAFIRELVRRAALLSALDGTNTPLQDRHLEAALKEALVDGGRLTKSLMGFHPKDSD